MELKNIKKGSFTKTYKDILISEESKKDKISDEMAQAVDNTIEDLNDEIDPAFQDMEWDEGSVVETDEKTSLPTWDYMRMHDFISLSYRTKRPLLIYGDPGIGKSQMVQSFTASLGKAKGKEAVDWDAISMEKQREIIKDPSKYFLYIDVRADSLDPTDLAGIPDMSKKEEWLETQMPKWLYVMAQPNADGILFLDECNNASDAMIKALYKVVDKKVGNIKLSDDFAVVAAGNLGAEFGGNPLPFAFTNRFDQGILIADAEQWLDFAEKAGVDKRIIAFVKSHPEENFNPKPTGGFGGAETHKQWASPRAIMNLSNKIKNIDHHYLEARAQGMPIQTPKIVAIKQSAAGLCGDVWARSFDAFMKHFKSFDYAAIVGSAEDESLHKTDRDKLHALLMFVLAKLKPVLARAEKTDEMSEADQGVLIGIAKITNAFKDEWKTNLFSHFKKDFSVEQLDKMMTFLLRGDYDSKVKKTFVEDSLPRIKRVLKR
jgi:hypothetical protein